MATVFGNELTKKVFLDALRVTDIVVLVLIGIITYWLRVGNLAFTAPQLMVLITGPLLTSYAVSLAGGYDPTKPINYVTAIRSITLGGGAVLFAFLLFSFSTKISDNFSRIWIGLWLAGSWAFMAGIRFSYIRWTNTQQAGKLLGIQTIIVGMEPMHNAFRQKIEMGNDKSITLALEIVLDGADEGLQDAIKQISDHAINNQVDDIVIAIPGSEMRFTEQLLQGLKHLYCNFDVCVDQGFLQIPFQKSETFAGLPILRIVNRPMEGWNGAIKWLEDKLLGSLILLLLLPFMGLIAIAIRMNSPGPALFSQRRLGLANREFEVWKFRTMREGGVEKVVKQATRDDPRITRIGAFLRRYSLDELPQLFNVLKGEMSLVGPRPHALSHNELYTELIDDYLCRHRMKPGMTGLSQIRGLRGEIKSVDDMSRRVQSDMYYIDNWSFGFDIYILILTIYHVYRGENAY